MYLNMLNRYGFIYLYVYYIYICINICIYIYLIYIYIVYVVKVSREGYFIFRGFSKVNYFVMILVRVIIVNWCFVIFSNFFIIIVWYFVV